MVTPEPCFLNHWMDAAGRPHRSNAKVREVWEAGAHQLNAHSAAGMLSDQVKNTKKQSENMKQKYSFLWYELP